MGQPLVIDACRNLLHEIFSAGNPYQYMGLPIASNPQHPSQSTHHPLSGVWSLRVVDHAALPAAVPVLLLRDDFYPCSLLPPSCPFQLLARKKLLAGNHWLLMTLFTWLLALGPAGLLWLVLEHLPVLNKMRGLFTLLGFLNIFIIMGASLLLERLFRHYCWPSRVAVALFGWLVLQQEEDFTLLPDAASGTRQVVDVPATLKLVTKIATLQPPDPLAFANDDPRQPLPIELCGDGAQVHLSVAHACSSITLNFIRQPFRKLFADGHELPMDVASWGHLHAAISSDIRDILLAYRPPWELGWGAALFLALTALGMYLGIVRKANLSR